MKIGEIKVGDLLYNENGKNLKYLLVTWISNRLGRIGGRAGYKKGTIMKTCKFDVGNDIEISLTEPYFLLFKEVDPVPAGYSSSFIHSIYLNDIEWLEGCVLVDSFTEMEVRLFRSISSHVRDNKYEMETITIPSIRTDNNDILKLRDEMFSAENALEDAELQLTRARTAFFEKYYPDFTRRRFNHKYYKDKL